MATTASSAANSASRYSIDSSMSRSRHDSSPWMPSDSDAIHHDPAPSFSQDDPFTTPLIGNDTCDYENSDKKPAWNKPSNSSAEVGPVIGAESWPALSLSNKSPSLESSKSLSDGSSSMPTPPQVGGTPPNSTSNVNAGSSAAAATATPSENHTVNGQRKPFRRNNNTSSSSSNISNPPNARDQYHTQRGASYGSGTTQFRNPHRNRNNSSYPRGDGLHHGNRRNYEHGNQSAFSNRNYNGRGIGMMRPQMLMGPPSFPASSAQYMAAPQLGSYGGPMLYPDYAPHIFLPHPPPESMALVGHYPPLPMYFPSFDAMLYNKILTQVEYYFSADNLSRDEHLRVQMDDEGWVPVRVIAGFRRLAELTNNIQTILEALRSSEVVEIKGETLRRRGDWDKYLLPREASKSGPAAAASSNPSLGYQLERMTLSGRGRDGE